MQKTLFLLSFLFFTTPSFANAFEASLSSQTAQFSLYSDSRAIRLGGSDLALRLFYNEANDFLAQAEIMSIRQADKNTPLTLGAGIKGYLGYLETTEKNIVSIAIGGSLRYTIPAKMPVTLYAHIFMAPQITSFSDTEEISDLNVGAQVEILPQTTMFVGYRRISINTKDAPDYRADDKLVHFGIRLTF